MTFRPKVISIAIGLIIYYISWQFILLTFFPDLSIIT
jgi:hypothetical protein